MKVKRWMKSLETQRLLWMMTVVLCMMAAPAWADIQQAMQTLRGKVVDVASGEPMPGVTLRISDMEGVATVSDADGQFQFVGIPVGRHTLEATFLGYDPVIIKELLLSSGKQTVVQVTMRECVSELDEVVVRPKTNKQQPLNEMAQVGARMFSVEETCRYAGGMADPARTASMFAGVASGGATNGISIHGNSPQMLQWRIEGIEVNNPNHFADITEAGGGIFSSLNGTMLANSDFMTGAMPAEYGNALSGVFDMKMRAGNNTRHEHSFQLGTLGIEFASEGPLGRNGKASYLVNYRYSFLEVAKKLHAINMEKETLDYQDLSMKFNFPTRSAGTFSLWFTGLYDNYCNEVPDRDEWETLWDMNDSRSHQANYAGGITHQLRLGGGGRLRTSMALTGSYLKLGMNDYDDQMRAMPNMDGKNTTGNLIFDMQHHHKFSARYSMQNGVNVQRIGFSSWFDHVLVTGGSMQRIYESDGHTLLSRAYTNHKVSVGQRLTLVAGVNAMWFKLNEQWLVEPRVSVAYQFSSDCSLAVAYALNSRKEATDAYFVLKQGRNVNGALGLTRSHHLSMTFTHRLGENALLKVEPYWQYLFDVPVEEGSTFSIVNNRMFYLDRQLVNKGAGRNYGVDLTLERYLKDGLYGMLTATLFRSTYRDAQGQWHSTRYDRRFVTNLLGGKEWMVGRTCKNVFGINGRITLMGGDRYTPLAADVKAEDIMQLPDKTVPEDGANPYTCHKGLNVGFAFSVKYTLNGKRCAHHFVLEYLKMRSYHGQTVELGTNAIVDEFTSLTFPNVAYRIDF